MALVNRRQLRNKHQLSASGEKLLQHLKRNLPMPPEQALVQCGVPTQRAWNALLDLHARGYVTTTGGPDEPILRITKHGIQHAEQVGKRVA